MNPTVIHFMTDFGRVALHIADLQDLDRMLRARGVFDLNDKAIRHEMTRFIKQRYEAGDSVSEPIVWRSVWYRSEAAAA